MRHIVIVDIDGTITDTSHRKGLIPKKGLMSQASWEAYNQQCSRDMPIERMCQLVRTIAKSYTVIFCTSRPESVREDTAKWLMRYLSIVTDESTLLMRGPAENRYPHQAKRQMLRSAGIEHCDIAFAIDDSPLVVEAFRQAGIMCLDVGDIQA